MILIERIINQSILLQALNFKVTFKFSKKKGGKLNVYDYNKLIKVLTYPNISTKSCNRKLLTYYFGNNFIK